MTTLPLRAAHRLHVPFWATVATGIAAWLIAWVLLAPAVDWLTTEVMGLDTTEGFGASLAFFLFDLPKVMLLLVGVVTAVSFLRSFVSPERVRRTLAGRNVVVGATAAAGFGIITPFCSCSAVPLFIGFVEAGVPLGVTFAFLIASPMVNEVALVLLWGLFGPAIAIAYLVAGLTVAIGAGLVIGRLHLERYVEPYVYQVHSGAAIEMRLTMEQRVRDAWASTRQLVRRIAPWVVIGISLGSLIHGYAPMDLVAQIGGRSNPLAVPLVIMLGVPLYANAAGTIPIVEALLGKGLPIGTVLAFMMAVTALSLPELMILRRVMKRELIAAFVAIVAGGIVVVGYLFNMFAVLKETVMVKIEVLGPGCANCQRLEANARAAVETTGVEAEVVHVTDYGQIMARGVMSTPGLVIDDRVVSVGRVPSAGDIAGWLTEAIAAGAPATGA